ncbi:BQ5605_C022g09529 [Microbotryum silenes-dioicae]|uniref:BQ5605_C022g09529 protein n=1 Tax=Microbotryum silenes-dioicae TaxID=796604 RepID=A0A2X0MPN4_9BASI|nr:BQ5605_C022g09529 [Microbotryum silenes-dioicae]
MVYADRAWIYSARTLASSTQLTALLTPPSHHPAPSGRPASKLVSILSAFSVLPLIDLLGQLLHSHSFQLRKSTCWNGLVQQKTISSVSTMGANWVEAVIASESEARDSWAQYSLESVQLGIA